jgi:2TM domain
MPYDIIHGKLEDRDSSAAVTSGQSARQQAIGRIERKRRFWIRATMGTLLMVLLAVIWSFSEYHNAGGWPTSGFSQSSGIPDVWNYWIIYPAIVWVMLTSGDAWWVFGRRPISESQIKREMNRQADVQD